MGIFSGHVFLLTQSRHEEKNADVDMLSAFETETEDDDMDIGDADAAAAAAKSKPVTMNKKELKKSIVKLGGTVLDEFPGPKEKIPGGVIVVSDRFAFFFVLARHYPVVDGFD